MVLPQDSHLMHIYGLKGGIENGSGGGRDFVTDHTAHWFG